MLRPPIERNMFKDWKTTKAKFMDDASMAVSLSLGKYLDENKNQPAFPLKYDERTGHILQQDNNLLQIYINDFKKYTDENKMKINAKKTNIMKFNRSKKFDFPLEVSLENEQLEEVKEVKILGIMINLNLKWEANTNYICQKSRKNYLDVEKHETKWAEDT